MLELEKHIRAFFADEKPNAIFLGCSGGVDSMVLLHAMHAMGLQVIALHVNYQLRGQDSNEDQIFVENACAKIGVKCFVKNVDFNSFLETNGGNLQEQARKFRYDFFDSFLQNNSSKIVLAHHADDQVETFFLQIARNAGVMGLAGMLPKFNNYWRPLLNFSKEEIKQYAQNKGIQWREDSSNASNKYNRNKLRNVFLPYLSTHVPSLNNSVLLLTQLFQSKQLELEACIQPIAEGVKVTNRLDFVVYDALPSFERLELLRQLEIPLSMAKEVEKIRRAGKGKKGKWKSEYVAEIINEGSFFYFPPAPKAVVLPKLQLEIVDQLPDKFTKQELYFSENAIEGELRIRKWKTGDRMRPIGLNGSKLISDILTDAKIPHHNRSNQLVVEDNRKIIWCVGLAIDQCCAGSGESTNATILKLTLNLPHESPISSRF